MAISRRDFLGTAALGTVAVPLISAAGMPMRTLGRTGTQVSILAFGGGSRFVGYEEQKAKIRPFEPMARFMTETFVRPPLI